MLIEPNPPYGTNRVAGITRLIVVDMVAAISGSFLQGG